ncbi:SixA phosphatase family protein [Actinophytocola sp. KF-1]
MNRTLVVIRHAKSDWSHDVPDDQRPLNPRGRREAPLIGQWVAEHVGAVDLVLCSTAVRARETLSRSGLTAAEVRHDERVYAAGHQDLMSVLDEVSDDLGTVALVGHNPGLSELVGVLTGEPLELKTSAIAVVSWQGGWPDVWARGASLVSHATPRG